MSAGYRMTKRRLPSRALVQLFMIIVTLMMIFPLYLMLANSFKTSTEFLKNPVGLPARFTFQTFLDAFKGKNFLQWFYNSIVLTAASIIVTTIVSGLAAFAFAKMRFRARNLLFSCMIPLMAIPPIVMLIPLFKITSVLHILNTRISVILIYTGIMVPFTTYMFRNFFISMPASLMEAALIDGAGQFQSFSNIMLPLSVPAIITACVVNAVWVWNELLIALVFLQKESLRTVIVGITVFKQRFTLNVPVIMAGLTLVTIPMIVFYVFGQRYLVQGLLSGAIKE
jgi:ABC-type glycerol-3-phosphate transport system permease component